MLKLTVKKVKKIVLQTLVIFLSTRGYSQVDEMPQRFEFKQPKSDKKNNKRSAQTPYIYLGPGMGINNYTGLLGSVFEVPIIPHFSAFMVGGLGGWGYKIGGGVLFYFREKEYLGSSFGLGVSNAFGLSNFETSLYLEGQEGLKPVVLNLYDAPTLNLTYQYHIKMGRTSKFVIGTGYAFALVDSPYSLEQPETAQISDGSELTMKMMQPGGLIISLAFQFGVGVR